jgi:hypothetical protein
MSSYCDRLQPEFDEAISIRSINGSERFILPTSTTFKSHMDRQAGRRRQFSGRPIHVLPRKSGLRNRLRSQENRVGYSTAFHHRLLERCQTANRSLSECRIQFKFGRRRKGYDFRRIGRFDAVFWHRRVKRFPEIKDEAAHAGLEFLIRVNGGQRQMAAKKILVISGLQGGDRCCDHRDALRSRGILACLESKAEMPALPEVEKAIRRRETDALVGSFSHREGKSRLSGMELVRCTAVYDRRQIFSTFDETVKETVKPTR